MPRDSNGTYSLPAGNPVVTLTTISTTWANTTLDDIATALTNSMDRQGTGGMTGQLKLSNGLIGAPALSWTTEPTSGLYRNGAGDFRYSIASNDVLQMSAALVTIVPPLTLSAGPLTLGTGQVLTPNGTALLPSHSFSGDPNTGIYNAGADIVGFSTDGAVRLTLSTTALNPTVPVIPVTDASIALGDATHRFTTLFGGAVSDGGAAANGLLSSTGTVVVHGGGTAWTQHDLRAGGANVLSVNASGLYGVNGNAGAPGYTFINDQNTGMFQNGADNLGFSTGGTLRANIDSTGLFFYGGREIGYRSLNGNAQNAGYTFVADDRGRIVKASTAGNFTINASVFSTDDIITFSNTAGGNCTLVQGAGVTFRLMGATGVTGNRTVADFGVATIIAQTAAVFLVGGPGVT